MSRSDPRPDVAFLVFDLRGSGVVRNILRIAAATAQAGMKVKLLVVHPDGGLKSETPAAGVEVVRLLPPGAPTSRAIASWMAVPALRRWIAQYQPRVLFSAGNHIHDIAVAGIIGQDPRPELIVRASNDIVHEQSGWLMRPLSRLAARIVQPALQMVVSQASKVVCVAEELRDSVRARLVAPADRIVAIPNGIDVAAARAKAAEPLDDPWFQDGEPPVLMGVGRLVRQKNFPLLLEAVALVRKTQRVRVAILGTGGNGADAKLMAYAAKLGMADDVKLLGFDPNPYRYLARADAFVLSSSWEGLSNVLLEALAVGTPVVATRCPTGTIEVLEGHGPLVPIEDAPALAEAISARLAAPRDSARLIARAQEFDLSLTLARYVQLLQRAVNASRVSASPALVPASPIFDSDSRPPAHRPSQTSVGR
jgi:glycosyltransferase involved in cell wall biosynthesis